MPAFAQGLHFGIKAGVPFTDYFETGLGPGDYSAATRRYVAGATGEWQWRESIGFEVDALFHRMGYVAIVDTFNDSTGVLSHSAIDVKGDSWDVPLLVKYRFGRRLSPYAVAGGVLRYAGPVRGLGQQTVTNLITRTTVTIPLDTSDPSELRKRFYPGVTAGGGIEFRIPHLRLQPEVRYTRWTANISAEGGLLRYPANQVEFLLGVVF